MNKLVAFVACAAMALCATSVEARKANHNSVDFGAISCAEFLQTVNDSSEDDVAAMMLWLDGYLSGVSGDTTLRFEVLEQFGVSLVERCAERGRETLLVAAKKVGLE